MPSDGKIRSLDRLEAPALRARVWVCWIARSTTPFRFGSATRATSTTAPWWASMAAKRSASFDVRLPHTYPICIIAPLISNSTSATAAENLRKHGVSFAHTEQAPRDRNALTMEDPEAQGEQHFVPLGNGRAGASSRDHSHTASRLHSRGICSQGEQIRGSRICEGNMTSAAESGAQ